jgi:excisionase family DNA binding protein
MRSPETPDGSSSEDPEAWGYLESNGGGTVDIKDLRERLACSQATAYALVASGTIPSIRLGSRMIRIRPQALDAWLLEQEQARG